MTENQLPQRAEPANLREIIEHAAERGQERHRDRVSSFKERFLRTKEKISNTWRSVRETGPKIGKALLTAEALARDPQIHAEMTDYARQRFEEGRKNVSREINKKWEEFNDRRRAALNAAEERIRQVARGANEKVVEPTVDGAKKIGRSAKEAGKAAGLFGLGLAGAPFIGAYKVGEMAVEGGRKGAEATKEAFEGAKLKAEEWGDRLVGFFERQGERVKNNVRRGINEAQAVGLTVVARGHEALAVPHQLRVRITELRERRAQAKTEAERQRFDEQIGRLREQLKRIEAERERRLEEMERRREVIAAGRRDAEEAVQSRRAMAEKARNAARVLRGGGRGR